MVEPFSPRVEFHGRRASYPQLVVFEPTLRRAQYRSQSWATGVLMGFTLGFWRSRARDADTRAARWAEQPEADWLGRFFQPDTSIFKQTRQYSTPDALEKALQGVPLNLQDLSRKNGPNVPVTSLESPAYRIIAFSLAFLAYPGVVRFLRQVLQLNDGENMDDLADVVTDFVTVETFVFGSYSSVTLTLQIQRLAELQANCIRECSLLSGLAEHTVELFDSLPKEVLAQHTRETVQRCELKALKAWGAVTAPIAGILQCSNTLMKPLCFPIIL